MVDSSEMDLLSANKSKYIKMCLPAGKTLQSYETGDGLVLHETYKPSHIMR